MKASPSHRTVWTAVLLAIAGVSAAYTLTLFVVKGSDAFASPMSCPAGCEGGDCEKNGCPHCAGNGAT